MRPAKSILVEFFHGKELIKALDLIQVPDVGQVVRFAHVGKAVYGRFVVTDVSWVLGVVHDQDFQTAKVIVGREPGVEAE